MHLFKCLAALALLSSASAQNASYCASGGVCYAVNIPASTASSGSGDIYFQISGPSSLSWIGLGQGSGMTGANIFMVYTDSSGTNVTLSSRLGIGNEEPNADTTADVTLLDGSGVSNGMMIANVRCANCNSWTGGSMSFTAASSSWIWAYKTGSAVSSDSVNAVVIQHSDYGTTTFNLQKATGGNSENPFTDGTAALASSSSDSSSPSSGSSTTQGGEATPPSDYNMVRLAHAILAPIAFVIFFPLGAMAIRLLSFRNLVWFHAGWMSFAYLLVLGSMGMGIWLAVMSQQLDTMHAHIGLIVSGGLILQPVTGLTHHLLYKRHGRPNAATYPHIWWGRAIISLGIINGGLGLQLSDNTMKGQVAYVIVAGLMWLLWMVVILFAFIKSRGKREGETGETIWGTGEKQHGSSDRIQISAPLHNFPTRESYSR